MERKQRNLVGIVTITGLDNYGNRLQNFALQSLIEMQGFDCKTLIDTTEYSKKYSPLGVLAKKIRTARALGFKESLKMITKGDNTAQLTQLAAFKKFNDEYIAFHDVTISESNIPSDLIEQFKYFAVGSDQIWNPKLNNFSLINLLGFAPASKRIATAPSFGVSSLTPESQDFYRQYLQDYRALSVREAAGQAIIKSVTGRDATLLVDPTLAISREVWTHIQQEPVETKYASGDYIVLFCLGDLPQYISDMLKNDPDLNGKPVINLLSDEIQREGIGPGEFLYIIDHAKFVVTDSFHGTVFSIIFNKQFYVFDRAGIHNDMNSRIQTLLSTFSLENRFINEETGTPSAKIEYPAVNKVINKQKLHFEEYLKDAFYE